MNTTTIADTDYSNTENAAAQLAKIAAGLASAAATEPKAEIAKLLQDGADEAARMSDSASLALTKAKDAVASLENIDAKLTEALEDLREASNAINQGTPDRAEALRLRDDFDAARLATHYWRRLHGLRKDGLNGARGAGESFLAAAQRAHANAKGAIETLTKIYMRDGRVSGSDLEARAEDMTGRKALLERAHFALLMRAVELPEPSFVGLDGRLAAAAPRSLEELQQYMATCLRLAMRAG